MDLLIIMACLAGGFVLAKYKKAAFSQVVVSKIMAGTVFLLLLFIGANLGKLPDLKEKLLLYGYHAAVITLFAIVGSMAVVWVFMRLFLKKDIQR